MTKNGFTNSVVNQTGRREFLKSVSTVAMALTLPIPRILVLGDQTHHQKITPGPGKGNVITILHTADIHAQVGTHDEFFLENGQATYRRRGGFAVLKTMINQLRSEHPEQTILVDSGDCFQGSGLAALSQGAAIVPLINDIGYDLIIPGNWEVVYKKAMMLKDLGDYSAAKICANMFDKNEDGSMGAPIFPAYWTKVLGGVKLGFIGYTDPNIPRRQPPAFSDGLQFTDPLESVAGFVRMLKTEEQCAVIFLVTHLGLAQQVELANRSEVQGVDYILGGDTHERVRKPIGGTFAQVTEPGAFGSFVGRLDLVVENGKISYSNYQLLEVDPEKFKPDPQMQRLIEKVRAPYKSELDKVIGKTRVPLVRYYVLETPMDNMITDALFWNFKPEVALSNGFRFCPPLVPDKKTGEAAITIDYLWSMVPVDANIKSGLVSGRVLWTWLEQELQNVFAKKKTERLGGWVVRMKGMQINFTIDREPGQRINWIKITDQPIVMDRLYKVVTCEREGDPSDSLCRLGSVKDPQLQHKTMHETLIEYLKFNSPVKPRVEGRVTATDAPAGLLSQLEGEGYEFY